MKYAIVEDGGKQFKAVVGETIDVDCYPCEIGEGIDLDRVLLVSDDGKTSVCTPFIAGAKIQATVMDHVKGPKLIVFKYKPKERIRTKRGHRQLYTRLRVDAIVTE